MNHRTTTTVGLLAQGAVNGVHSAPVISRTSSTSRATYPETLPTRLLPVKGSATYLGVSVRSLWRLVDALQLHPVRLPGLRRVAFDVRELDALIEASRE